MLLQVEIRAVGNAPKFAPAEGEHELDVRRRIGVMRQLLGRMVAQAKGLVGDAEGQKEVVTEIAPVREPLQILAGLAEEFKLHLLELARAEREVAGRDLVAEGFADLRDTHGQLAARRAQDVVEVDEDALCGLGAKINFGGRVLGHALERLEHQIELADGGEVMLTALGAGDVEILDHLLELGVLQAVHGGDFAVWISGNPR